MTTQKLIQQQEDSAQLMQQENVDNDDGCDTDSGDEDSGDDGDIYD